MTMLRFTPGPWRSDCLGILSGAGCVLADACVANGLPRGEIEANIVLMAAAPDLLEVAGLVIALADDGSIRPGNAAVFDLVRKARAALARACAAK